MELLIWLAVVLLAQGITFALLRRTRQRPPLPDHPIGEYIDKAATRDGVVGPFVVHSAVHFPPGTFPPPPRSKS